MNCVDKALLSGYGSYLRIMDTFIEKVQFTVCRGTAESIG
ncbi:hypothetical protein KKC1_16270 [Calderihabitans maritimus]|uniref:Uncharacterized protein n=1 Tax=Calderihabitans maritimus TaxID=1246530 RepID=A0A1Z5HSH3_9FIRM|nr:hypothetical protein KKC1_16270 [Calderihabitans maritimus]